MRTACCCGQPSSHACPSLVNHTPHEQNDRQTPVKILLCLNYVSGGNSVIHVVNSSMSTVIQREMDFWQDTMNELYDIVWKIKQQQHSEKDLHRGLELIDEADEEPWVPHALL